VSKCMDVFGPFRLKFSLPVAGCGCNLCRQLRDRVAAIRKQVKS
jgi:hypothetical protein